MAAGFYQRAANPNVLHGEGTRFAVNHYNFDVRRDTQITKCAHDSLLESRVASPDSEKLLKTCCSWSADCLASTASA